MACTAWLCRPPTHERPPRCVLKRETTLQRQPEDLLSTCRAQAPRDGERATRAGGGLLPGRREPGPLGARGRAGAPAARTVGTPAPPRSAGGLATMVQRCSLSQRQRRIATSARRRSPLLAGAVAHARAARAGKEQVRPQRAGARAECVPRSGMAQQEGSWPALQLLPWAHSCDTRATRLRWRPLRCAGVPLWKLIVKQFDDLLVKVRRWFGKMKHEDEAFC